MSDKDESIKYIETNFKVLTKADENNISHLAPMKLWPAQRHYLLNRTNRDVVVKNRQQGFSSGVMAANAYHLFTQPYQRQALITHDQETSEFLFQTVQRFHKNLPDKLRPKTDWKSGARMRFPDLDSYIYIDSAKSDNLGIGHTLNSAHLSEIAKYPPRKAAALFADISQTVPAGGFITAESSPKGRVGQFCELYQAAKMGEVNYQHFFYPWWWDITCVRKVTEKMVFINEEQQMMEKFKLVPEQIAFRREKIAELKDLFYQEYPENDVDCFLGSDISVFDGLTIRRYMQMVQDGRVENNLTIWKDVIGGEKYVIGVDAAGGHERGDFSVAAVIRVKTNEYVARLRGRVPPDLFAQETLRLGRRYNDAEIGVEQLLHGRSILKTLLENNYPNIYYYEDFDILTATPSKEPGWRTNRKTKPIMVDTMGATLRAGDLVSWSSNLMDEAAAYVWDEDVAKKTAGKYDDELDAVMIALQLRNNVPLIASKRYGVKSYARI